MWDKRGLPQLNALRTQRGLARLQHLWDQVHEARRELVMTSPAFDFPAALPAQVRYVGPVMDDPLWAGDEAWQAPPGSDPLVLVAMSSTFQNHIGNLQRVVDALGTLPVRALVTTGPSVDPGDLVARANVNVIGAAPHGKVLPHVAAVVTHGGHGTVMKALAAGAPMVVMHHGRDQADNAARITARGAGIALKRTAGPTAIASAVNRVLADPSYRANARRLGEAIRRDAAGDVLLRELEDLTVSTA
jgi:MGT family glycosyltransferase